MKLSRAFLFILLSGATLHAGLKAINETKMAEGGCWAGSRIEDKQAFGGFGPSDNYPMKVTKDTPGEAGKLALVFLTDDTVPYRGTFQGIPLLLINKTAKTAEFTAEDSRLSIVQEALDKNGRWRPIEYLRPSWCGNSFHRVFLPASQYWVFTVPRYYGPFETKLRARFQLSEKEFLYSNEYDGGISTSQFKAPPKS